MPDISSTPANNSAAQSAALKPTPRPVRAFRVLRLGLHLFWGCTTVAFVYPFLADGRRLWLKQRWSRQLLELLGIRLDAQLSGIAPGSLVVANHISWLDIYALNAARPLAFISKSEVRDWPVLGWLAAKTDTIFLVRGNRRAAIEANAKVEALLGADKDVGFFPEGTTTEGDCVLHFHGALLQPAIDAGRPLQPVAISYHDAAGRRSTAPAYAGETTMGECIAAILACRRLTVRLRPTPPIETSGRNRRELALAAHGAIAYNLGLPADEPAVGGGPEAVPAD